MANKAGYTTRYYRDLSDTGRWNSFRVKMETTDLLIRADRDLAEQAEAAVSRLRNELFDHAAAAPEFISSYSPLPEPEGCSPIVAAMYAASSRAGVGPLAAVAGAQAAGD